MKRLSAFAVALAAFAMASCTNEMPQEEIGKTMRMSFSASFVEKNVGPEPDVVRNSVTKSYIEGKSAVWSSDDIVAVYDNVCSAAHPFSVTPDSDPTSAVLDGEVCTGATSFTAVTPATASSGLSDGELCITVPGVQKSGNNGIDESAFVSVAKTSGGKISFLNVNGMLKLNVNRDDITEIRVRTTDAKALAGKVGVNPETGVITKTDEASSEVVLLPSSATFARGTYYIPVLPFETAGIALIALTSEKKAYVRLGTKSLKLERNHIVPIGDVATGDAQNFISASLAEATSSTLMFTVAEKGSTNSWRFALYSDSACSKLVVAHNIPAAKTAAVLKDPNRFVFAGLEPGTNYWFKAVNTDTGVPSDVVAATTADFTNVSVPASASEGDVVLAEDFGELAFFGTYCTTAAGWFPFSSDAGYRKDFRFSAPSGEQTQYYYPSNFETRLFTMLRDAIPHSRLADWAEWNESTTDGLSSVCAKAGHLKIGTGAGIGYIVTPKMSFIPEDKSATLKVTVTAAKLNSDNGVVKVVTGDIVPKSNDNTYTDPYNFEIGSVRDEKDLPLTANAWTTQTVTVSDVVSESRLAFGTKRSAAGSGWQPFVISDMKVELVSFEDRKDLEVSAPVVNAVTAFTDARLSWDAVNGADGYRVYVGGEKIAELTYCEYTLTELAQGTATTVEVEAYNSISSEKATVNVETKGLRQCGLSTGTTFLCIDWDPICKTRNNGQEQAYQVQIFEDQACTKKVYDFTPYDGQKTKDPCFGNSSWFGRTKLSQNGITCSNYLTPTRISIGGLCPSTTYYVRVRTLASVTMKYKLGDNATPGTSVLTNAYGDSEWSEPVAMTTDSERQPDANTIFYTGFNDFCVQSDYKSWAPGAVPAVVIAQKTWAQVRLLWNASDRIDMGFAFYPHGQAQHQTSTFRLSKDGAYVDGTAENSVGNYLIGCAKGEMNAITGDLDGWHFSQWARPFMGMVGLDGTPTVVCTPAVPEGKVDAEGSECTVSFSAVARVRPDELNDNWAGTLVVWAYRAATGTWEQIGVVSTDDLLPFANGSSKEEYKCDFTGHVHSFTATLNPGDAVELGTTSSGIILVDDFTVTRK